MFLDETFICCDVENKSLISSFLKFISNYFKKIIFTSHSDFITEKLKEEDFMDMIYIKKPYNDYSNINFGKVITKKYFIDN